LGAAVGDVVLPGAPVVVIRVGALVVVPVVGTEVLGGWGIVGDDVVDPDGGAAVVPGATVVPVVGAPVVGAVVPVAGVVVVGATVGAVVEAGVSEKVTTITTELGSDR